MATAKMVEKVEEIERKVIEKKVHKTYILELSEDEAHAIFALVGHIIGPSQNNPRKFTDNIWAALRNVIGDTYGKYYRLASTNSFKNFNGEFEIYENNRTTS